MTFTGAQTMAGGFRNVVMACALVGGTMATTATVVSQHQEGNDWEAMERAWAEYMTPGEEHAELAESVGHWDVQMRMWMMPGAAPEESRGIAEVRPIMGGRYFVEDFDGLMKVDGEEVAFEGKNILGYDKHKEKYVYCWFDDMGTGLFVGEGTKQEDGSIVFYGDAPDFLQGGMKRTKSVSRELSSDKHQFEMYEQTEDGWRKTFEMTYTRRL
jgi:hypothetical protein